MPCSNIGRVNGDSASDDNLVSSLPAPSSLLSSRWSHDSPVTGHPSRLYDGRVLHRIGADTLDALVRDFEAERGPIRLGAARLGVFTWDIACVGADGPFVMQVPILLDEPGWDGRARRDVPRLNFEHVQAFIARGLTRFLPQPRELLTLGEAVPVATFSAFPDHRPLVFGRGRLQVELAEGRLSWLVSLGAAATADLVAEMIGALVYHYEPDEAGGTTLGDVCVNDGDFVVRRGVDGGFDLRLTAARRRERGVGKNLLLLCLIQLMAYEDWRVGGELVGLPVLVGNPSVAFEGVVRGLRHRYRDLGLGEDNGVREAMRWVRDFGRSREGHGYRPWAERFVAGELPVAFGDDPRERWWRLVPLQTKLGVTELRARDEPGSDEDRAAREIRSFLDRLSREIGRAPRGDEPGAVRINDVGRADLVQLLEAAGAAPALADALLARWPYRSMDHLVAVVPGARALRRLKSRIVFGDVLGDAAQGTLPSASDRAAPRAFANPETFGGFVVPAALADTAVQTFPTFEAYVDAALHDPTWGYYAQAVSIGGAGHFNTHPEALSPRYGGWIAERSFRCWLEMIARGEIAEGDPFPLVEFGAGNGRLARDALDAVARNAAGAGERRWSTFAARLRYHVYETSPSLREKQRALLGDAAVVAEGDARRPAQVLARDFPGGLRGLVVSNEVPDAFGVHKLLLTPRGRCWAALVVARTEANVREALGADLAHRIGAANETVRRSFGLAANPGEYYLDGETYAGVMAALAGLPPERREALLDALWFEEAYVPAAAIPELGAHLAANAAEYALALAAEESAVMGYVNLHASRFIRELGASLAAGFVITIDYGDTTSGLLRGARRGEFPFRVYGPSQAYIPRPNDPYAAPGTQDLTADVNFTDLAQAAAGAGLCVIHYGPERDLVGDGLRGLVAEAAIDAKVAEFIGNPVFKILVLGTRPSDVFTGALLTPTPLFGRAQDVPKGRRDLIPIIQHALEGTKLSAAG
jgi:SAM-dependent MidA family methyltransferase